MNFGTEARPLGRFIVDIDGSLRATDAVRVSPADIIALHGGARLGSSLLWERNGETIALSTEDRIELDESTVYFFRTAPKRRLHQAPFASAFGHSPSRAVGLGLSAAA